MIDVTQGAGWWQASDGNWYPPEYRTNDGQAPRPRGRHRQQKKSSKRNWLFAAGAAVVAVVVLVVVVGGSGSKTPGSPVALTGGATATTVNPLPAVASAYEGYLNQATAAMNPLNTAVNAEGVDITKQDERAESDATTYTTDEFGGGCTGDISDYTAYDSCVSQEEQAAASALSDENAANAAGRTDQQQQANQDQQEEGDISTFVQQLDSISWPSSVEDVASNLEQALSNDRDVLAQDATDLADAQNFSISADNEALSTATSDVSTELINMATALGISPPSSSPST
jgi:hypothetical protein